MFLLSRKVVNKRDRRFSFQEDYIDFVRDKIDLFGCLAVPNKVKPLTNINSELKKL